MTDCCRADCASDIQLQAACCSAHDSRATGCCRLEQDARLQRQLQRQLSHGRRRGRASAAAAVLARCIGRALGCAVAV